jgi:hypothetical protein
MDFEQVVPEFVENKKRSGEEAFGLCSTSYPFKSSHDAVSELLGSHLSLNSPSGSSFCQKFRRTPATGKRNCDSFLLASESGRNVVYNSCSREPVVPALGEGHSQDSSVGTDVSCDSVSKRRKTVVDNLNLSHSIDTRFLEIHGKVPFCTPSPTSRYKSPLRRGDWPESWQSARSLGASSVQPKDSETVVSRVKHMISMVIQRSTCLSLATLDKWLTLLCDFIEFNADEYLLFLVMLRKYLISNGQLQSLEDHVRPQKWERVLAVCAYFVVFLSEEFTGRIRRDLEDLMGPAFHFGREQASFLWVVDWRVNVTYNDFEAVRRLVLLDEKEYKTRLWQWLGFPLSELDSSGDLIPAVALKNTKMNVALMKRFDSRHPEESEAVSSATVAQGDGVPKVLSNDKKQLPQDDSIEHLISSEIEEYQKVPC